MPSYALATTPERPYFFTLPVAERNQLMRGKFSIHSRFFNRFGVDMCDLDCGPFSSILRGEVIRILEKKGVCVPGGRLEDLHHSLTAEQKRYGFNDGVNLVTTYLYETDEQFIAQYHAMIKECVQQHFPYPFLFQAIPTIRIHCPDAENSHHYPRYHTDINYGHPPEEINLWIPLTEPLPPQQHGFRMMKLHDSQRLLAQYGFDFAPFIESAVTDRQFNERLNALAPQVSTPFGKMLAFDSRCIHTAEPLLRHTRVSIDIRIIAEVDFEASEVLYQGVGRRKIRYLPGEAYHSKMSTYL